MLRDQVFFTKEKLYITLSSDMFFDSCHEEIKSRENEETFIEFSLVASSHAGD